MRLKHLAAIFLLISLHTGGQAQSGRTPVSQQARPATGGAAGCSLTLAQSPSLLGLRLGMTKDHLLSRFPNLKITDANDLGVSTASLPSASLEGLTTTRTEFEKVESVTLELTDGRLSYMRLGYPPTNKWRSLDDFLSKVADWLGLSGDWKHFYEREDKRFRDAEDFREKTLECGAWRISVGIGVEGIGAQTPHIKLEDVIASKKVEAREAEKSRRAASEQKPGA
jgi:hypothetical protein